MKRISLLIVLTGFIAIPCLSQELTAKEKADDLAKNVFSKSKEKKIEKYGVVKDKAMVIESIPVANNNAGFYEGNYWYKDLNYKIEIRSDANKNLIATLSIPNKPDVQLKKPSVTDAYFIAAKPNENGTDEKWEGVFINRSDNGNIEFGLGIKLSNPIQLTEGLKITRIFFKKVSP